MISMKFSFKNVFGMDRIIDGIYFYISINGKERRFIITKSALQDHFGVSDVANNRDLIKAFKINRKKIEAIAKKYLNLGDRTDPIVLSTDLPGVFNAG